MKYIIFCILLLIGNNILAQDCFEFFNQPFKFVDYNNDYYSANNLNISDSIYLNEIELCIKMAETDANKMSLLSGQINRVLLHKLVPLLFAKKLLILYLKSFRQSENYFSYILMISNIYKISYIYKESGIMKEEPLYEEIYTDCTLNTQLKKGMLESDFFLGEWKQVDAKVLKRFFESCDRSMSLRKMRCKTKSKAIRNGISEMELYIKQNNLK